LTAAAVDNDCLQHQYASVPGKCVSFINLASRKDMVLKVAYPAGDLWSDLFGDNDSRGLARWDCVDPKVRRPAMSGQARFLTGLNTAMAIICRHHPTMPLQYRQNSHHGRLPRIS
jgi:hypothetical protein